MIYVMQTWYVTPETASLFVPDLTIVSLLPTTEYDRGNRQSRKRESPVRMGMISGRSHFRYLNSQSGWL
jgi:hypothetical protein